MPNSINGNNPDKMPPARETDPASAEKLRQADKEAERKLSQSRQPQEDEQNRVQSRNRVSDKDADNWDRAKNR